MDDIHPNIAMRSRKMDGIGSRIEQCRKSLHWSQTILAKRLKRQHGTIARWENNKGFPKLYQVKILAKLFNVSEDWLLYGEESINTQSTNVISSSLEINDTYLKGLLGGDKMSTKEFGNNENLNPLERNLLWFASPENIKIIEKVIDTGIFKVPVTAYCGELWKGSPLEDSQSLVRMTNSNWKPFDTVEISAEFFGSFSHTTMFGARIVGPTGYPEYEHKMSDGTTRYGGSVLISLDTRILLNAQYAIEIAEGLIRIYTFTLDESGMLKGIRPAITDRGYQLEDEQRIPVILNGTENRKQKWLGRVVSYHAPRTVVEQYNDLKW